MRRVGLALVLVLAMATAANASIIYDFVAVVPSGPNFIWTYEAHLSNDQKINSAIGAQFGTIFDFPGTLSATSLNPAVGLTLSTATPLTSSQAVNQAVTDNPAIPNVVTTITGSFTPVTPTPVIYQVMITSTLGGPPVLGSFQSGQALKNAPGDASDNTLSGNTVRIEGPSPSVVPEPSTLLLLGASLVGVGGYARHRLRRQQ